MDADEILELLSHPRFLRLNNVPGGWQIIYKTGDNDVTFIDGGTLDLLLARFANILDVHQKEAV